MEQEHQHQQKEKSTATSLKHLGTYRRSLLPCHWGLLHETAPARTTMMLSEAHANSRPLMEQLHYLPWSHSSLCMRGTHTCAREKRAQGRGLVCLITSSPASQGCDQEQGCKPKHHSALCPSPEIYHGRPDCVLVSDITAPLKSGRGADRGPCLDVLDTACIDVVAMWDALSRSAVAGVSSIAGNGSA